MSDNNPHKALIDKYYLVIVERTRIALKYNNDLDPGEFVQYEDARHQAITKKVLLEQLNILANDTAFVNDCNRDLDTTVAIITGIVLEIYEEVPPEALEFIKIQTEKCFSEILELTKRGLQ